MATIEIIALVASFLFFVAGLILFLSTGYVQYKKWKKFGRYGYWRGWRGWYGPYGPYGANGGPYAGPNPYGNPANPNPYGNPNANPEPPRDPKEVKN